MIRLVTQYSNRNWSGNLFPKGEGWDGGRGPWIFNIITNKNIVKTIAKNAIGRQQSPLNWANGTKVYINSFRLELIYE